MLMNSIIPQKHQRGSGKMKFSKLFEPAQIGHLKLRNRIVMPAMGTNFGTPDGYVTEKMQDYYEERARGGAGLVIVECACVDFPRGKGPARQPAVDDDRFIPGLSELVQAIHEHGARAALQLHHAGKDAPSKITRLQPVAPSVVLSPWGVLPKELTVDEIADIIDRFARAAERARKAGFDAVEIHATHGHSLIAQFLSRATNKRADAYGGELKNRARLLLEIIEAIKNLVGEEYPVWCRVAGEEKGIQDGITLNETQEVAQMVQRAGADAIHVSIHGAHLLAIVPESPGALLPLAQGVKRRVKIPVIAVGRIDPQLAEKVLQEQKADFIAMGRALIADPELPHKVASGKLKDIRPCIYCYRCFDASLARDEEIRCSVNAALGREREYQIVPAERAKRVAVIGGGPAGMEAARVAALRGHRVVLYEKGHRLGGQLVLAGLVNSEFESLPPYFGHQLEKLGVEIKLGRKVSSESIETAKPDVVIVSTGAMPLVPEIPGIERDRVISAADFLGNRATKSLSMRRLIWYLGGLLFRRSWGLRIINHLLKIWMPFGKRVIVVGGEMAGCEIAKFLADKGRKVTIVERSGRLGAGMVGVVRRVVLDSLAENGVQMLTHVKYEEITDKGLVITTADGERQIIEADTIVLATGMEPKAELFEALQGKGAETYLIGDCATPRNILEAIHDGARIAGMI